MRLFSIFLIGFLFPPSTGWETNFEHAKEIAHQQHKNILLNFSGSDWCGPCIRMRDEFFEIAPFKDLADSSLVLLNADFPRMKKNQLSKEQQKENNRVADQYNPHGLFPLTLLLDETGKVIFTWEGYPAMTPSYFINQVKILINAR